MILLVDSREQLPYWQCPKCCRIALNVGDYTTVNLLGKLHVERKSMADLYGTITKGHARFRREILRASSAKINLVIVIEGSRKAFIGKEFSNRPLKVPSRTLDKILTTIETRYGLEIHWKKDREVAQTYVYRRLRSEEKTYR
jgi:DNA excision repair protein ERCC-4